MKKFIIIFAALLAFVGIDFARILTPEPTLVVRELASFSPDGVYKIACGNYEGTAFVVSSHLMFTALHVAQHKNTCRTVGDTRTRDFVFTVAQKNPEHDFAILKTRSTLAHAIPINCDGVLVDRLYTIAGYPGSGGFAGEPATGVNQYFSRKDAPVQHMRAMRGNTKRGMSGGPVLTDDRQAVGFLIGETTDSNKYSVIKEFRDLPICSEYTK